MNVIKYRPVGSPSGKVVRVKVSQSKRAIYSGWRKDGTRIPPAALSVARADHIMSRKGYMRAGRKA